MVIESHAHHAQGYRAILGIMSLGRKYGSERLETACGMALKKNSIRYRDVKSISFLRVCFIVFSAFLLLCLPFLVFHKILLYQ